MGPTVDSLTGIIRGKVFAGQHVHGHWCYYNVQMEITAALVPAMPFDGEYSGVSREVLDSDGNESRCYPRALTPPAPLTIANGVVGIPGVLSWEGTVSPQGSLAIRDREFSRVDGQIDRQGTIRGQYTAKFLPGLAVGPTASLNSSGKRNDNDRDRSARLARRGLGISAV